MKSACSARLRIAKKILSNGVESADSYAAQLPPNHGSQETGTRLRDGHSGANRMSVLAAEPASPSLPLITSFWPHGRFAKPSLAQGRLSTALRAGSCPPKDGDKGRAPMGKSDANPKPKGQATRRVVELDAKQRNLFW